MTSPAYSPGYLSPTAIQDQNLPALNEFPSSTASYASKYQPPQQPMNVPLFDQPPPPAPNILPVYHSSPYYLGSLPYFTPQYIVPTVIRTPPPPPHNSAGGPPLVYPAYHHQQPYFFCSPNVASSAYGAKIHPGHLPQYGAERRGRTSTRYAIKFSTKSPTVNSSKKDDDVTAAVQPTTSTADDNISNNVDDQIKYGSTTGENGDCDDTTRNDNNSSTTDNNLQIIDNGTTVDYAQCQEAAQHDEARQNETKMLKKNGFKDGDSSDASVHRFPSRNFNARLNGEYRRDSRPDIADDEVQRSGFVFSSDASTENGPYNNRKPVAYTNNINSNNNFYRKDKPKWRGSRRQQFGGGDNVSGGGLLVHEKLPDTQSKEEFPDISSSSSTTELLGDGHPAEQRQSPQPVIADWSKITKMNIVAEIVQHNHEDSPPPANGPCTINGYREHIPTITDKAQQTDDLSSSSNSCSPTPPPFVSATRNDSCGVATTPKHTNNANNNLPIKSATITDKIEEKFSNGPPPQSSTSTKLPGKSWASLFEKNKKCNGDNKDSTGGSSVADNGLAESGGDELLLRPTTVAAADDKSPIVTTFAEISSRNCKLASTAHSLAYQCVPTDHDEAARNLGVMLQSYQLAHRGLPYQLRGLINSSSWCYINATLQALIACPPFVHLMRDLTSLLSRRVNSATPFLDAFVEFAGEFSEKTVRRGPQDIDIGPSFEPSCIYDLLAKSQNTGNFLKGRQEDAEEFLSLILNNLHEEMLKCINYAAQKVKAQDHRIASSNVEVLTNGQPHNEDQEADDGQEWQQVGPNKKAVVTRITKVHSSPIASVFAGVLRNTVHQSTAKNSTANLESFFVLPLDIQSDDVTSLSSALQRMHKEVFKTVNRSKNEVVISRRTTFQELPTVFILQLKYFVFTSEGQVKKLFKSIEYGMDLTIDRNLLTLSNTGKTDRFSRSYKLFSVVYHHGNSVDNGHYTASVFHGGFWVHIDDTKVCHVTESHVLGNLLSSSDEKNNPASVDSTSHRVPYLLFYRRCDNFVDQRNRNANYGNVHNNCNAYGGTMMNNSMAGLNGTGPAGAYPSDN